MMQRKFLSASTEALTATRQVKVICSTDDIDRAGEVIVQSGIDLGDYQTNPVVLWQHDPMQPIARAVDIGLAGGKLQATVQFPDEGVSPKADEVYGLIKAGVINSTSVGFDPIESEPMDPNRPRGPQRYLKCGLMEFSFVSVPANPGASIVARSAKSGEAAWKCGASLNLPINTTEDWDGQAAEASIFDKAEFDGDDPDTTLARKGFLAYDSANADLKGSYKLPIAKVIDGRLTVLKSGIDAAASRLPQSDLPDDVQTKARAVLDHYEGKIKEAEAKGGRTPVTKAIVVKDLYQVAQLAYVLADLGWIEDFAEWEAEMEQDGSKVPSMLAEALKVVGDALLAMTAEEVQELLGAEATEAGAVAKEAKPIVKAFANAKMAVKAGRVLSNASREAINGAIATMGEAVTHHKSTGEKIESASALLSDLLESAGTSDELADPEQGKPDPETSKSASRRAREIEILRLGTPKAA
jgi:HK97 family phage prohead protease